MDYLATYPYAYIRYHDSDMQLHIYKETADHVFPKAQTIIRGFYRLTNTPHTNDRFIGMVRYLLNEKHYAML